MTSQQVFVVSLLHISRFTLHFFFLTPLCMSATSLRNILPAAVAVLVLSTGTALVTSASHTQEMSCITSAGAGYTDVHCGFTMKRPVEESGMRMYQQLGIGYPAAWQLLGTYTPGMYCEEYTYGKGSILCHPNKNGRKLGEGPLMWPGQSTRYAASFRVYGACGTHEVRTTVANAWIDDDHGHDEDDGDDWWLNWVGNSPWVGTHVSFPAACGAPSAPVYNPNQQPVQSGFWSINAPQPAPQVTITPVNNQSGACNDGRDNDGDGFVDARDIGCYTNGVYNPADNDEWNAINVTITTGNGPRTACNDGIDNDGDGQIDRNDIGCHRNGYYDATLTSEYNAPLSSNWNVGPAPTATPVQSNGWTIR